MSILVRRAEQMCEALNRAGVFREEDGFRVAEATLADIARVTRLSKPTARKYLRLLEYRGNAARVEYSPRFAIWHLWFRLNVSEDDLMSSHE